MSRNGYKINRNSFDYARSERVSWIDEFANNIEKASKTAVEVARERDQVSLHQQISSIVSRKPAHATVEDLVKSYHERTGLSKYLEAKMEKADKVAFSLKDYDDIFEKYPGIRDAMIGFAKNKINTSYGQCSVPHIQDELKSQFASEGIQSQDIECEKVAKFISDLITAAQKETPATDISSQELGKGVGVVDVDSNNDDNTDFYQSFMAATD